MQKMNIKSTETAWDWHYSAKIYKAVTENEWPGLLNRYILSPSGGENPKFCHFWTSAFCAVASWQQSEKVEHVWTTANLPLSNGIKIVSVLRRLRGEIGRTNSDVEKTDGQTDRHTDRNRKHHRAAAKPAACAKPLGNTAKMNLWWKIHPDRYRNIVAKVFLFF